MKVTTVNVHAAKTQLSKLLARVAKGEKIVIAKAGRPVAQLTAVPKAYRPKPGRFNLNSEVEQVVLVLLLVLVLENSRYLAVTLIKRNSAGIFGSCFDAEPNRSSTSTSTIP
jgi:prevent-host-death family protein